MILLAFSIILVVDQAHHRLWGAIVAFLYGPASYIMILILLGTTSSSNLLVFSFGLAGLTAQTLGAVGGIWGFFAGTSWTPLGVVKGLVGPTGRVFFGGLVSSFSMFLFGASIFLIGPFLLVLGPLLLRVASSRRRIVGAVLIAASVATALPFVIFLPYLYLTFGGLAGYDTNIPSFVAIILGGVLAGSGAVQLIKWRRNEEQIVSFRPI